MASLTIPLPITHPKPQNPKPLITRIKKPPFIRSSLTKNIEPLHDDGYMTSKGIKEYRDAVTESLRFNEGPPRWFCPVDCGPPIEGSPILLFLPGVDGIGMGLFMHHKALGRNSNIWNYFATTFRSYNNIQSDRRTEIWMIFEVRSMHVPFSDRTSFEGLLNFVEDMVKIEHSRCQDKPIYLLGHCFGGCLALSVAARNPNVDLIVLLTNPATSFDRSWLQLLLKTLRSSFCQMNFAFPSVLSLSIDGPLKLALENIDELTLQILDKFSTNFVSPLILLSYLVDNISNETISWKLKLLSLAADQANSHLHAIKAEVLVLSSCMASFLPNRDEGERLRKLLPKCKVYYFENRGHNILMGEQHKLLWPAQPEFVRMAAQFGATIVPFGVVGEDDICTVLFDYDDLMSNLFIRQMINQSNHGSESRDQELLFPYIRPKIPGRFYYLFGKPISLEGKMEVLKDKERAKEVYLNIKSEVESMISFLLKKREEDDYRSIFRRMQHEAAYGAASSSQMPTFDP